MIFTEKLREVLEQSLDSLDDESRQKIADNPGTSARQVGDDVEFSAAGIVYAVVDSEWLADDQQGIADATLHVLPSAPDDISELTEGGGTD
ncbi:hypothetical protein GCM10007304_14740 [Rhodococcoides trifolii]|uniref:Uncharacterized protein n=1 Tax=Rhodococcoides trifolii TaxID=908250 RepID=A0A917CWY0_9NOCA|nr:hypothetical protein [Rhodococcus trifolii]GGG01769.1 hypothetical protein GCM10007304_14740 [Rhodococcus trifolii]